jgi:hypothetical protein
VHRREASQYDSLAGEGTETRRLANERHPAMSSTAHFKQLEQTLLATGPARGPGGADDDAENSRSSIILGE